MKLKLDNHNRNQIPEELKSPTYYLDDLNTHFICDFNKEINNHSSFIGYSGEFKINTINFFIGANNSGKSRLLKLNTQSIFFHDTHFLKKL